MTLAEGRSAFAGILEERHQQTEALAMLLAAAFGG